MLQCRVLVLEDEQRWLEKHRRALEENGIKCVCTADGNRAVQIATQDLSIMVGVIDEILRTRGEPQNLSGTDVVRQILKTRPEMQFVMISAKPYVTSGDDKRKLLREERKLRRAGVRAVYHKVNLEEAPREEYAHLAQLLKRLNPEMRAKGKVLVGFGFDRATLDDIRQALKQSRSWWLDVSRWCDDATKRFIVDRLFDPACSPDARIQQVKVFYLGPNARHPVPVTGLRPSEIKFLTVLARKAALSEEACIGPGEYSKGSQGALKTVKCRVERCLSKRDRDLRFKPWVGGSYKAEFEIGTLLFSIEAPGASASQVADPRS